jgi:hypothetical protein
MQIDQIRPTFQDLSDEDQLLFIRRYRHERDSEFTRIAFCRKDKQKRTTKKANAQSINKNTVADKVKRLTPEEKALLKTLGLSMKDLKGLI